MNHTYTNEEYNNWDEYVSIVMKWRKIQFHTLFMNGGKENEIRLYCNAFYRIRYDI